MNEPLDLTGDAVYAIGDIHGNFGSVVNFVKNYDIRDAVVFCCGDIGLGFEKPESDRKRFNRLENELSRRGVHAVLVRGNHDSKERFAEGFYGRRWNHVHPVPDYTVVYVRDVSEGGTVRSVLCIGGATSIDRTYRQGVDQRKFREYKRWHPGACFGDCEASRTYWSDEHAVYDEAALDDVIAGVQKVDVVCTHTAPSFCEPLTKGGIEGWLMQDEALESDLSEERGVMDRVYARLVESGRKPLYWVYGHFHFHNFMEHEGTRFYLLDMVNERTNLPDVLELRF